MKTWYEKVYGEPAPVRKKQPEKVETKDEQPPKRKYARQESLYYNRKKAEAFIRTLK